MTASLSVFFVVLSCHCTIAEVDVPVDVCLLDYV